MKRPYKRRCGASLPKARADEGWYWCDQQEKHSGNHTDHSDGVVEWRDQDTVCVVSYDNVQAVRDHEHDFIVPFDDAKCSENGDCPLTRGEYKAQQAWWEQEQQDICSHCGHAEHCHTHEASDEGGRDYCTECEGADEFHAMDEEPKRPEVTRERLLEVVRGLLGPSVPQERLEAAVDRMGVMLALGDPEPVKEPEKAMTARLKGPTAHVLEVDMMRRGSQVLLADEVRWGDEPLVVPRTDPEEDPAVECECGTVWRDGVMGKGHNDMDCEQEDPDEDICACGCKRREHRSSLTWGVSCEGCTAKGPRSTYQWRHPFTLLRG